MNTPWDKDAPYGRKADGTPRKKAGRPRKNPEAGPRSNRKPKPVPLANPTLARNPTERPPAVETPPPHAETTPREKSGLSKPHPPRIRGPHKEPPATSGIYELGAERSYLRFPSRPVDAVCDTLRAHGYFYQMMVRVWYGLPDRLDKVLPLLEEAGVTMTKGDVGIAATRRDKKAKKEKEEQTSADDATTLTGFDFSEFPTWAKDNFVIKDKETGVFVPFVLNSDQQALFDAMIAQWRECGFVRINIVKHRQRGISTFIQLFILYLCLHVPGVEALVTAHRDDAALAVFRRAKIAQARCPLKRDLHLNNRREVQFKEPWNSALRVAVAGGDDGVGRGEMRQVYHASEPAHYNRSGVEAQGNVEASIPDAKGTLIWRETTANGKNHFYEAHKNAKIAGFRNFFIGFLNDETCRVHDVALEDERWASVPIEWKQDEPRLRMLAKEKGLSDTDIVAALCFRRQAIAQKCMGLTTIFMREFPATVEDAFASTGCHVFPLSVVDAEWEAAKDAEAKSPAPRFTCNRETKAVVPDPWGRVRIWKEPEPGASYIIAGDFASGKNVGGEIGDPGKLDATTLGVLDEATLEEVAVWYARAVDPDLAAEEMAILGHKYNGAMLIPEGNNHGQVVTNKLVRQLRYPRVFRKENIDKPTDRPVRQNPLNDSTIYQYGWWVGSTLGKDAQIEWLNVGIRERIFTIHEPEFWEEATHFVRDEHGDCNAESGRHDDRISRWSILAAYIHLHPKPRRKRVAATPPPRVSADGNSLLLSMKFIADKSKAKREAEAQKNRPNWA